jgi:hypothetical protein
LHIEKNSGPRHRQIAKTLGVAGKAIDRDTATVGGKKPNVINGGTATNVAVALSGEEAARAVAREERKIESTPHWYPECPSLSAQGQVRWTGCALP